MDKKAFAGLVANGVRCLLKESSSETPHEVEMWSESALKSFAKAFDALQPVVPCSEAPSADEGSVDIFEYIRRKVGEETRSFIVSESMNQRNRHFYRSEALQEVLDHILESRETK